MLTKMLCSASLLICAATVNANVIVQEFTVASQNTNISETISFDLFDDMAGTRTLEAVEFSLNVSITGFANVENLNEHGTNISAQLAVNLFVNTLLSGNVLALAPTITELSTVGGFDGSLDFEGTSGLRFLGLSIDQFEAVTLIDETDLSAFSGIGLTTFDFLATASSNITGGGNLASEFVTIAGASIKVVYTFEEGLNPVVVNEPIMLAMFGASLLLLRRFRDD